MIEWDEVFRVRAWNTAAEVIFGYAAEEMRGKDAQRLVAQADREKVQAALTQLRQNGDEVSLRNLNIRKDGTQITCDWLNTCLYDASGSIAGYASLIQDASEQADTGASLSRANQQLERHNRFLQLLNELAGQLHRTSNRESIARQTVDAITGFGDPANIAFYLQGDDAEYLNLVAHHGFDEDTLQLGSRLPLRGSLCGLAIENNGILLSEDIAIDDRLVPVLRTHLLARGARSIVAIPLVYNGRALGAISLVYSRPRSFDPSEWSSMTAIGQNVALALANAAYIADMEHHALHDSLTGLPNREYMHAECVRLKESAAGKQRTFALLLFDIDRFKEVNDTLGHQLGDQLLVMLARRVQAMCVDRCRLFCRLGGDEFALIVEIDNSADEAYRYADTLLSTLGQVFRLGDMALEIRASMGLALYPEHADNSHELLRCAEVAMYQAKHAVSGFMAYQSELDQHSPDRLALMGELSAAIREDQLELHYQPKVSLLEHRVSGFEALLRWEHPRMGLIPPGDFIALAEMGNVIHSLTEWVLDQALAQLKSWHEEHKDVSIAINISTRNLVDQGFPGTLSELIRKHAVDPTCIELEITETALISDPERAQASMNQIADLGVVFSIDDFGTGYSSLGYLKRLPVQALKIDRSFVNDMLRDQQDLVIVRSTVNLARNLGLKVIAEGVEDEATFETLRGMGCDFVQGFYISQALESAVVHDWWKNSPIVVQPAEKRKLPGA